MELFYKDIELINHFKIQLKEIEDEVLNILKDVDDSYSSNSAKYEIKHIFKERMWQLKLLEIDEKIK